MLITESALADSAPAGATHLLRIDRDREPGRFLLTGSQSFPLMRGVSESLAGRVAVLQLDPFSVGEVVETPGPTVEELLPVVHPPDPEPPAGRVAEAAELVALARDEGVTVFLTTHNLLEAEKVCDRVAVIRRGSLLAEGSPEEIHGGRARRVAIAGSGFTPE